MTIPNGSNERFKMCYVRETTTLISKWKLLVMSKEIKNHTLNDKTLHSVYNVLLTQWANNFSRNI